MTVLSFSPSLGMGFCVMFAGGRLALFCLQRHRPPTFVRGQALVSSGDPAGMVFLLIGSGRLTAGFYELGGAPTLFRRA